MIDTKYIKRQPHTGDYSKLLSQVNSLEPDAIKAACKELFIPYLPQTSPRLLAKRLEKTPGNSRLLDSILRKPVTYVPLPDPEEGDQIVELVVLEIAAAKGIQPDEVNIPKAIPDSWGFYEESDPACGDCPYSLYCADATEAMRPPCFRLLYSPESIACKTCLYSPWCSADLVVEP